MKTLIIGLGNPILTDDGVGVKVAYALQKAIRLQGTPPFEENRRRVEMHHLNDTGVRHTHNETIDITEASVGGLRLMEMMVGYDKAIIIDALKHADTLPGEIHRLSLPDLEAISPTQHSASAHDTSLVTALATGRRMGMHLPQEVVIYGIGVENIEEFGDQPTAAVQQAIPTVTAAILNELDDESTR
ncbi:MAG: hydrogenase maturation protease [Chloroflexi bacterium]|nr:hydrogenase maturation protease [Chloroflexota bacterium]